MVNFSENGGECLIPLPGPHGSDVHVLHFGTYIRSLRNVLAVYRKVTVLNSIQSSLYTPCVADEGRETKTSVSPGGPYDLVSHKMSLVFPCSLKVFVRFWCSLLPKLCFCSRVPSVIFLLFSCSQKVNGHVPLFPETPGEASNLELNFYLF